MAVIILCPFVSFGVSENWILFDSSLTGSAVLNYIYLLVTSVLSNTCTLGSTVQHSNPHLQLHDEQVFGIHSNIKSKASTGQSRFSSPSSSP